MAEPFYFTLYNDPRTNPMAQQTPVDGDYWIGGDKPYVMRHGEWGNTNNILAWQLHEKFFRKTTNA